MKKNHEQENILIDYLDGLLTSEEQAKVEFDLANSAELRTQLEELKMIFTEVDTTAEYQPSGELKNNFNQLIQKTLRESEGDYNGSFQQHISEGKEKIKNHNGKIISLKNKNRLWIQIVAAVGLILFGFFIGKNLTGEKVDGVTENDLAELRTEMLDLLKNENSTSGRIKAVNIAYKLNHNQPDKTIVDALIKRLNEDESTNVRLSAMDALFHFVDDQKVVTALCETLSIQTDPIVQIAIIEGLTSYKEKGAIKYFEELIENDHVIDHVKDEAQMGIYKMM